MSGVAWCAGEVIGGLRPAGSSGPPRAWLAGIFPSPCLAMSHQAEEAAGAESDELLLVEAARAGDPRAFAELVRAHSGRVARLVARFARSRADLEDLSQEVFIEVHRCLDRFDGRVPISHWIARIATRRCYDYLRRHYRRRWLMPWTSLGDGGDGSDCVPAGEAEREDPRVESLRSAVAALPPEQRLVITLLEIEERSVREISALTGWSEGNVKVRAHRAREALRRALTVSEGSRSGS